MDETLPFLLLHGPWRGPWWWEPVVAELAERGFPAEAPALPGHCPEDDRSAITFENYAEALEGILRSQATPVVLVAHSATTALVQAVAPLVPEALRAMIFVQPLAVPDGRRVVDLLPPGSGAALAHAARQRPDLSVPVCPRHVEDQWMPGELPYHQSYLVDRLLPQPLALLDSRVPSRGFQFVPAPRVVVYLALDRSLPPPVVLRNARRLAPRALRSLPLGSEGPWLRPALVATALISAVGAEGAVGR